MKQNNSKFDKWRIMILAVLIILCGFPGKVYCQEGTALLLQQTPSQGGEISLGEGVHYFELGTRVALKAVPKPGYQFIYWIGDVSDATSNNTIAYLDTPKIIIAVFERAEYDVPLEDLTAGAGFSVVGSASLGAELFAGADYVRQGGGGLSGRKPYKQSGVSSAPAQEPSGSFPVPKEVVGEEGEVEFPVPIPEPATGILLGLGSLLVLRRRRKTD